MAGHMAQNECSNSPALDFQIQEAPASLFLVGSMRSWPCIDWAELETHTSREPHGLPSHTHTFMSSFLLQPATVMASLGPWVCPCVLATLGVTGEAGGAGSFLKALLVQHVGVCCWHWQLPAAADVAWCLASVVLGCHLPPAGVHSCLPSLLSSPAHLTLHPRGTAVHICQWSQCVSGGLQKKAPSRQSRLGGVNASLGF